MILVDTSVWIDHFNGEKLQLIDELLAGRVICHSAIIGELAVGNLPRRNQILDDLDRLPKAFEADSKETLFFLHAHKLFGKGLGWIDVQLLAAAAMGRYQVWTHDTRLRNQAKKMGLAF